MIDGPSFDVLFNLAAVLFLRHRLRTEPKPLDLWLFSAGVIGFCVSLLALFHAAASFKDMPRDAFSADLWDFLLCLQLAFGFILLFTFFATVVGLPPVIKRVPWRTGRWFMALPASAGAGAGWLSLCNAALFIEEHSLFWLLLLGLALALTFSAVSLATPAGHWPRRSRVAARFGGLGAAGAFLLAARFTPLVKNAVWNADILQQLTLLVGLALFVLALVAWLAGGEAPRVVLFLRRFGKTDLNRTLGRAARGRWRGIRFRMVTLDDRDFAPLSGERRPVLAGVFAAAVVVGFLALAVYVFLNFFSELFGVAEERLGGQALAMSLVWIFLVALLCLIPTLVFLGWAFWRSWARRRTVIASSADVNRLSSSLIRPTAKWQRARALSSPRALVVTTEHELWKEAVLELIKVADLVFLDLSELSDSVLWELDRLREQCPTKAVILTQQEAPVPTAVLSGSELRLVSYRSYSELEKVLGGIMAELSRK